MAITVEIRSIALPVPLSYVLSEEKRKGGLICLYAYEAIFNI
jgi:hypothetical protein